MQVEFHSELYVLLCFSILVAKLPRNMYLYLFILLYIFRDVSLVNKEFSCISKEQNMKAYHAFFVVVLSRG